MALVPYKSLFSLTKACLGGIIAYQKTDAASTLPKQRIITVVTGNAAWQAAGARSCSAPAHQLRRGSWLQHTRAFANASGIRQHVHVGLAAKLTTRSSLAAGNPAPPTSAELRAFMPSEDLSLREQTREQPKTLTPGMLGLRLQRALLLLAGKRWI